MSWPSFWTRLCPPALTVRPPELSGGRPAVNPQYHRTFLARVTLCPTGSLSQNRCLLRPEVHRLVPDVVGPRVGSCSLLSGRPVADSELPLLPVSKLDKSFHAQYQVSLLPMEAGIRYLTEYAQNYDPIQ